MRREENGCKTTRRERKGNENLEGWDFKIFMRKKNIEKETEKERSKYGITLITYGSAHKKNS